MLDEVIRYNWFSHYYVRNYAASSRNVVVTRRNHSYMENWLHQAAWAPTESSRGHYEDPQLHSTRLYIYNVAVVLSSNRNKWLCPWSVMVNQKSTWLDTGNLALKEELQPKQTDNVCSAAIFESDSTRHKQYDSYTELHTKQMIGLFQVTNLMHNSFIL